MKQQQSYGEVMKMLRNELREHCRNLGGAPLLIENAEKEILEKEKAPFVVMMYTENGNMLFEDYYIHENDSLSFYGSQAHKVVDSRFYVAALRRDKKSVINTIYDKYGYFTGKHYHEYCSGRWEYIPEPNLYVIDKDGSVVEDKRQYMNQKFMDYCTVANRYDFLDTASELRAHENNKKKASKIEAVMAPIKEVSSTFLKYVETKPFDTDYLMYDGENGTCGWCGNVKLPKIHPKHNKKGKCPVCGKPVIYVAKGRMKYEYSDDAYCVKIERYGVDSILYRFFKINRIRQKERFDATYVKAERVRIIIHSNGKEEKYKYYHSTSDEVNHWMPAVERSSYYGYYGYSDGFGMFFGEWAGEGIVYSDWKRAIKKTWAYRFGYADLMDEISVRIKKREFNVKTVLDYPICVLEHPKAEWLCKCGCMSLLDDYIYGMMYGIDLNDNGKNIYEFLKLPKEAGKRFIKADGDRKVLEFAQVIPKESYATWNELANMRPSVSTDSLSTILKYTTVHKALRYCHEKDGRDMNTWADYLVMANKKSPISRKDTFTIFPKDLAKAHDEIVKWKLEQEEKERKQARLRKVEALNKVLESYHKKYDYKPEKADYLITAPNSGLDIEAEGRLLRTCLWTSDYVDRMAEKKTAICFVRKTRNPEKHYCSMEISDGMIQQLRGYSNMDPDLDTIKFVSAFAKKKNLQMSEEIKEFEKFMEFVSSIKLENNAAEFEVTGLNMYYKYSDRIMNMLHRAFHKPVTARSYNTYLVGNTGKVDDVGDEETSKVSENSHYTYVA